MVYAVHIENMKVQDIKIFLNATAQTAGAVEYIDCISTEMYNPTPNQYPGDDTKQYDGEAPAMEIEGMRSIPLFSLLPGPF